MASEKNLQIKVIFSLIHSDRTIRTLITAIILIVIMGSLRPNTTRGMYEKKYWATKISWENYADAVVTGDSRVLGGISPSVMQEVLKERTIVNFGFASNLYDGYYLAAVEKVLKEESKNKTVILGITPHSLTKDTEITGQFSTLKNLSKQELFMQKHFASLISFFEYMSFRDVLEGIYPKSAGSNTYKELFPDGWLAYSKKPPGKKKELGKYLKIYDSCKVTQKMTDNLLKYVSDWNEKKIKVYGFLMPTCQEMVKLEEEISGFNLIEFKITFENSGGIWIEIDPAAYDSFDGSHLQRESAIELSRNLASKIYEIEKKK